MRGELELYFQLVTNLENGSFKAAKFFDVEYEEDNPSSGEAPGSRLKVVGRLADQCQDALVQLGTFLASSHAPDEYAARLPPLQVAWLRGHGKEPLNINHFNLYLGALFRYPSFFPLFIELV